MGNVKQSWPGRPFSCSIRLITPASRLVWDYFPPLRLTFYPWRLLSMTSVATAVLEALSLRLLTDSTKSRASFLISSLLFVNQSHPHQQHPLAYPPRQTMPETISLARALQEELPPYFIGTTTLGEFLPQTVVQLPAYLLENDQLRAGENPDRLQALDSPTWTRLNENPLDAQYQVAAQRLTPAVYRQFNFPGLAGKVDGQSVPITASQPHGLITFPVPAGQHDVQISFTNTWSRWLGWAISTFAFAIVARAEYSGHHSSTIRNPQSPIPNPQSPIRNPQSSILR
ncbi:MAG: hypothetical protein M5U34_42965 [Chloroflexi bacterium]|nr:hypothetical protein [Chloroflexota bacterium]